jgi:3-deoxy-7-phosphoheptulonate synthase
MGQVTVVQTRGNLCGHIILRGGDGQPNYDSVHVALCEEELQRNGLPENIIIDCSHGNSNKQFQLQPLVVENVASQLIAGNKSIIGIMLESNLHEGNQVIPKDLSQLKYGVSVTDACISWETTESTLRELAGQLQDVLPARMAAAKARG